MRSSGRTEAEAEAESAEEASSSPPAASGSVQNRPTSEEASSATDAARAARLNVAPSRSRGRAGGACGSTPPY